MRKTITAAVAAMLFGAAQAQSYSYEDKDWGTAPTTTIRSRQFHSPTPLTVPGARTIKTVDLKAMLGGLNPPVVIDVLNGKPHPTVPGAHWMPWAGFQLARKERIEFEEALAKLTGGNKAKPIAFLCLSSECWLSYNSSLHAVDLGYTDVLWYRGGVEAWKGASYDTVESVTYRAE